MAMTKEEAGNTVYAVSCGLVAAVQITAVALAVKAGDLDMVSNGIKVVVAGMALALPFIVRQKTR